MGRVLDLCAVKTTGAIGRLVFVGANSGSEKSKGLLATK